MLTFVFRVLIIRPVTQRSTLKKILSLELITASLCNSDLRFWNSSSLSIFNFKVKFVLKFKLNF
jgi:hypothetical protein